MAGVGYLQGAEILQQYTHKSSRKALIYVEGILRHLSFFSIKVVLPHRLPFGAWHGRRLPSQASDGVVVCHPSGDGLKPQQEWRAARVPDQPPFASSSTIAMRSLVLAGALVRRWNPTINSGNRLTL